MFNHIIDSYAVYYAKTQYKKRSTQILSNMTQIVLKEFLQELKRQIKESEDVINPIKPELVHISPKLREARHQYFVTKELEVEIAVTSKTEGGGQLDLFVVQLGSKVERQEIHRVKIKMNKQGHRFRK